MAVLTLSIMAGELSAVSLGGQSGKLLWADAVLAGGLVWLGLRTRARFEFPSAPFVTRMVPLLAWGAAGLIFAADVLTGVADRAMQVFGAMGVSPDTPLADLYTAGRVLRFADGPDEVHLQTIARLEIKESADKRSRVTDYLSAPG